jgi:hypothetical protein
VTIRCCATSAPESRVPIAAAGALAVEVSRCRQIYDIIRPHQAIGDGTPRDAYLNGT